MQVGNKHQMVGHHSDSAALLPSPSDAGLGHHPDSEGANPFFYEQTALPLQHRDFVSFLELLAGRGDRPFQIYWSRELLDCVFEEVVLPRYSGRVVLCIGDGFHWKEYLRERGRRAVYSESHQSEVGDSLWDSTSENADCSQGFLSTRFLRRGGDRGIAEKCPVIVDAEEVQWWSEPPVRDVEGGDHVSGGGTDSRLVLASHDKDHVWISRRDRRRQSARAARRPRSSNDQSAHAPPFPGEGTSTASTSSRITCQQHAEYPGPSSEDPDAHLHHVKQILRQVKPALILCSTFGCEENVDLTSTFRRCPSVQEYILFGPRDTEKFGRLWQTWGRPDLFADTKNYTSKIPPYEMERFVRQDNPRLSRLMLGVDDRPGMVGFYYATHFVRRNELVVG